MSLFAAIDPDRAWIVEFFNPPHTTAWEKLHLPMGHYEGEPVYHLSRLDDAIGDLQRQRAADLSGRTQMVFSYRVRNIATGKIVLP